MDMLLRLLQWDQSSIKTRAKTHCNHLSYSGGKWGRQESLSPGQMVTGWFLSGHWPDAGWSDSNQMLLQISGSTFFGQGTKRDLMGWTLGSLCLIVWGHPSVLCPRAAVSSSKTSWVKGSQWKTHLCATLNRNETLCCQRGSPRGIK